MGRAEIKLPGDNWQSFPVVEDITQVGGDRAIQIKNDRKVLVKRSSSNTVSAILFISGSSGMGVPGKMYYSPSCKSNQYWYRQGNDGFHRTFAECWGVLKGLPIAPGDIAKVVPELAPVLSRENLQMPKGAHTLFSAYRNENGTFLTVEMFVTPGFSLSNVSAVEAVTDDIDPKLLQYGRQLSDAVRASVTSWSGQFVVPIFNVPD